MIPEYGTTIRIQPGSTYEKDGGFKLIKELLEKSLGGNIWYFDQWGNKCSPAKEDELPLEYYIDGQYYIELRNYEVNQDNFVPMTVYCFSIFKHGYQAKHGTLTNHLAYTDPRDCLDAARYITFAFKPELEEFFNRENIIEEDLNGIIIGDDGNVIINPEIEIDFVPLEELDKHLIQDITVVPPKECEFKKPVDHPRFYPHHSQYEHH